MGAAEEIGFPRHLIPDHQPFLAVSIAGCAHSWHAGTSLVCDIVRMVLYSLLSIELF